MIMDLRSGPIMTLSLAYSKSIISTFFLLNRAAFRAASLTRLARSAPEKPGVPRAMTERSTFSASGVLRVWTFRICSRPRRSGPVHDDAAVEAAGPQERRVQDVRPVGRGDEDDALVRVEAVHLDEQRVQRLLALVVSAAEARAAVPADGVDLVDEDDAGRVLLALLEEVADARGADAHEHLDEVRARDREEGDVRLAGDGAREQRLAGAGRADQEDALGDLAAELLELLRVLEELDDLLELDLGLLDAGDVLERHLLLRRGQQLRAGLAEGEGLVPAGLHLPHDHEPDRDEQDQRPVHDQRRDEGGVLRRRDLDLDALGAQVLDEVGVVRGVGLEAAARACRRTAAYVPRISSPRIVTFWTWPWVTWSRNCEKLTSSTAVAPVLKTFQARMISTRMTIQRSRFLIVAFKGVLLPGAEPGRPSLTDSGRVLLLGDDLVDVRQVGVEALVLHAVAREEARSARPKRGEKSTETLVLRSQRLVDDGRQPQRLRAPAPRRWSIR